MPRELHYDVAIRNAFANALVLPERDAYLAGILEALAAQLVKARTCRDLESARERLAEEGDYQIRRRRAAYWIPVRRAFWQWVTAWGMELR